MRQTRRPSWLVGLRLVAALALGGGAYAVYLMACGATSPTTSIKITPTSLPNPMVNTPYSQTLTASGGTSPYGWVLVSNSPNGTVASTLPPGLTLDNSTTPTTTTIHGTPLASGSGMQITFTVQATSSDQSHDYNTAQYTVTVGAAPTITVTPSAGALPGAAVGTGYSEQLSASGGTAPYLWTLASGSNALPTWLTLDATTTGTTNAGLLHGTPPSSAAGLTYNFTVKATDANTNAGTAAYTLTVAAAGPSLTITTTGPTLPGGTKGSVYDGTGLTFAASGGTAPYTWGLATGSGPLPPTLTINPASGLLSGTTTTTGTYPFTVQVTDNASPHNTATAPFSITVAAAPPSITTTSPLPNATYNTPYVGGTGVTFAATGGTPPYQWAPTAGHLPMGITLLASGLLSGTPAGGTPPDTGAHTFTVTVTDAASNAASAPFTLYVATPPIAITSTSPLPAGTVNQSYTNPLAATGGLGTGTYAWAAGAGLPPGLTLNVDGTWSGAPTSNSASPYSFTATVTSGNASPVAKTFSLPINPASSGLTIVTGSPLPSAEDNTYYGLTFTAMNGTPPYTWTKTSPAVVLPPGLNLTTSPSAGGLLSGKPTSVGSTTFSITVTDASSATATGSFMLAVNAASASCVLTPVTVPDAAYMSLSYYRVTFTASGACGTNASPPWSVPSGSIPTGFSFNMGSSADSASLTANGIGAPPGTYNFSISYNGNGGTATVPITLTVH